LLKINNMIISEDSKRLRRVYLKSNLICHLSDNKLIRYKYSAAIDMVLQLCESADLMNAAK